MATKSRHQRRVVASHRRPSAIRPRDWRVRVKLAAVLVIPLLSFLVIAGLQVAAAITAASDLDRYADRVRLGHEITGLVHELQRERDHTTGMLASLGAATPVMRDVAGLAPDWTAVDRAADQLRSAISPLLADAPVTAGYQKANALLAELAQVRSGAGQGWLRAFAAFDFYTRTIAEVQTLLPASIQPGGGPDVARAVGGFTDVARAKELTAQIRGYLFIVANQGAFRPGEFERIADIRAQTQAAWDRFRANADPAQLAIFDDTVTGQAVSNASRLTQAIIAAANSADLGVDAQQWWLASTTQLELIRAVEQRLLHTAGMQIDAAASRQWRSTLTGSLATVALLLIAVTASALIGRGMASTLRSLREQALSIAQHRLPNIIEQLRSSPTSPPSLRVDPIIVHARDEVGEVAEAFTAVHRSAVRLAAEQAHMRRNVNDIFIKLARRSQALVERQLRLLDTMESTETQPDQLANLFRLDHLATRLRRNDENLLVLADGDTTRGSPQPVELNTVLLAATAEIEQYTRVQQEAADRLYIVGYAVTDLVHLIAELLENAASFSPPNTQVSLVGKSKMDGGAQIVVADKGIGMTASAIAEANQQLRTPVSIDVSSAERMGLVVVSHLAKRHSIKVLLTPGGRDDPGTTALIDLPATLIAPAPEQTETAIEPIRWLRAEDVLRPQHDTPESVWWSKEFTPSAAATVSPVRPAPPRTDTGVFTSAGLPKRRRQALAAARPEPAAGTAELNPEATESMLSSLYSGVRRADTEPSKG